MMTLPVSPLLEARNVTRILPLEVPVTLVKDVSLCIRAGEFVSITGPSGSGKSSLLYLLGLLDRPSEGEVLIKNEPTSGLSDDALSRLRLEELGFVFQFHFLLAEFSITENVMIPMNKLDRIPRGERRPRAEHILNELGLGDHLGKNPSQLSGGQRQRVAIARAMANEPALILADEPTGNLDTKSSQVVYDLLQKLVTTYQTSILMVTHNQELAAQTDRNIHLVDGVIVTDKAQHE